MLGRLAVASQTVMAWAEEIVAGVGRPAVAVGRGGGVAKEEEEGEVKEEVKEEEDAGVLLGRLPVKREREHPGEVDGPVQEVKKGEE